jgi:hypothetical protein
MPAGEEAGKWVRRFLTYIESILRHTYILSGSAALTIVTSGPSWFSALFQPTWQTTIDRWWLISSLTHWLTWIIPIGGVFLASFFAWNETQELLESSTAQLAAEQSDRPDFQTSEIARVHF